MWVGLELTKSRAHAGPLCTVITCSRDEKETALQRSLQDIFQEQEQKDSEVERPVVFEISKCHDSQKGVSKKS